MFLAPEASLLALHLALITHAASVPAAVLPRQRHG